MVNKLYDHRDKKLGIFLTGLSLSPPHRAMIDSPNVTDYLEKVENLG